MQTIALSNAVNISEENVNEKVFGDKVGLMGRIFGCWHEDLSRPFVQNKTAYRSCLNCGARKEFDTKTFKTIGSFYYPPIVREMAGF